MLYVRRVFLNVLIFFLFGTAFFLCFYRLGARPLERWDEQTNAKVVSEILHKQTPVILYLNNQPFFEKPPLWYFLTSGVVKILGLNNFSLRFISALSGFILIIILYQLLKSQFSQLTAVVGGFSFLSIGQLFINNAGGYFSTHNIRSADGDILQILLILLSTIYFSIFRFGKIKYLYLAVIFSAFAFMTKGPLGLLPDIIFIINYFRGKWEIIINPKHILLLILIFLLITLPWYAYMFLQFGNIFLSVHFGYHILERFLTPLENHHENFWYYLEILSNPRTFSLFSILIISLVYNKKFSIKPIKQFYFPAIPMIIGILLVAELAQTKLAWYILGSYPFITYVISKFFYDTKNNKIIKLNSSLMLRKTIFAFFGLFIFIGIIQNFFYVML
jgi:4-amino-4-deoxy-L-arabinose transferase-like glycosyltransferase